MTDSHSTHGIILLLDSDSTTRAILRDALSDAGYLVATANDLGMAVDRLQEMPPDLLIVRPYINSMSGHLAADYLRTKLAGLPVLIVGGFPEDDRLKHTNEVQKFSSFPPPFRREDLVAKVRELFHAVSRHSGSR